jgi:adenylosuccinate lyase
MIDRYSRPQMKAIWEAENKFRIWMEIEIYALEALARAGQVPPDAVKRIKQKAKFDIARIEEIEKVTRHDVIAFLQSLNEFVGEDGRYIHMGLTSSDLLDTCLAIQLIQSADIIIDDLKRLLEVLKRRAFEFKNTPMIGRSHGIHAEPTTFGLKMALWYEESRRNLERMQKARETIAYGKLSGAVGTFAHNPPEIEEYVMEKCGLKPAPISTQIVQRDRHAEYFSCLAIIASSLEKFAVEIRHLQRTEVYEAEEYFHKGQKGSSAMPHKRNPVLSENISGLARVVRANAVVAMENVPLWHERDISHSSAERIIGPDSNILIDFMIDRLTNIIDKLIVYPENMKKNLNKLGGLVFSQQILLKLISKGLSRERAYELVQLHAMDVWESGGNFAQNLMNDAEIREYLSNEEIEESFDLDYQLRNIDKIFKRVYGD